MLRKGKRNTIRIVLSVVLMSVCEFGEIGGV